MAKKRRRSQPSESARFLRVAQKRLHEGQFLLDNDFTTAAVYLSGYAVECALKSLMLSNEPVRQNRSTLEKFRGQKAHELEWLQHQVLQRNILLPQEVIRGLTKLNLWATELRYDPKEMPRPRAALFLRLVHSLVRWTIDKR
jgi:hypothetical protein